MPNKPALPPVHAAEPVQVWAVHEYPFPIRIPPSGCSAVPLPKKKLHTPPGPAPAGEPAAAAVETPEVERRAANPRSTVSPSLLVATVGGVGLPPRTPSRRANPNTAQVNGSPSPDPSEPTAYRSPNPSHDNTCEPSPGAIPDVADDVSGAVVPPTLLSADGVAPGVVGTDSTVDAATNSAAPMSFDVGLDITGAGLLDASRTRWIPAVIGWRSDSDLDDTPVRETGEPPDPADEGNAGDPDPRCERTPESPGPDEEELDPADPADPAVSANATAGNATTTAPTPNAAASAPTRPIKLDDGVTPGRSTPQPARSTCLSRMQAPPLRDFARTPAGIPAPSCDPDIRPPIVRKQQPRSRDQFQAHVPIAECLTEIGGVRSPNHRQCGFSTIRRSGPERGRRYRRGFHGPRRAVDRRGHRASSHDKKRRGNRGRRRRIPS